MVKTGGSPEQDVKRRRAERIERRRTAREPGVRSGAFVAREPDFSREVFMVRKLKRLDLSRNRLPR